MSKKSRARVTASPPAAAGGRDWGLAVLVCVATFVAYMPALRGELIWNDSDYVTAPHLRSLAGLADIWFKPGATEQYYPLLHSFFWVQHKVWGDAPLGYHLMTQLLHTGGAILFALLLKRLAVPGAWLAALLFALHPVHVESVAWITEQKNTLSLIFYLGAGLLYLEYDVTRRPRTWWAALGLFAVSLLCKTVTATLPAALLVVFWWQRGRLEWRRDFRPLLPWLVLGASVGLFTSWVEQHYLGAKGAGFDLPWLERGLVAGRAFWFYLGQIVWPLGLNFIYPRWIPDATEWWQWLPPLAVLALAGLLWLLRNRTRTPFAVLLLFAGSLFPVLGFVNLYGGLYSWVWDHWQYLPDLAPLALLAASLTLGWARVPAAWRQAAPVLALMLLLGLGSLSWRHSRLFHDSETLFRGTIARNPGAWMAHFNLGGLLAKEPERLAEAIPCFEEALRLNPTMADAHYNLGTILTRLALRQPEAFAHFESALRLDPANAAIHYNYANALAKAPGRTPDALAHYRESLRLKPDLAGAHYNMALLLLSQDRALYPEAIAHLEETLRLTSEFPLAREIVDRWRSLQR